MDERGQFIPGLFDPVPSKEILALTASWREHAHFQKSLRGQTRYRWDPQILVAIYASTGRHLFKLRRRHNSAARVLDVLDCLNRIEKDVGVFIGKIRIDKEQVRKLVDEHTHKKPLTLALAALLLNLKPPTLRRELARAWHLVHPNIRRVWKREGMNLIQSL